MTTVKDHNFNDTEEFIEVLIKNLPPKIKAGNEKDTANINEMDTIEALKNCKFMNFNSKERISFMVFDIDTMENITAKQYFKRYKRLICLYYGKNRISSNLYFRNK